MIVDEETIDKWFADLPKPTRWQRFKWRLRNKIRWPQCPHKHSPYRYWTDEQCRESIFCSNDANEKSWYCQRRKYHFGECQDIQGKRWRK